LTPLVVGIGPETFQRNGGGAIIGYQNQHGCGWVGGNGEFFPTQCGKADNNATFTKGMEIDLPK
jgi:hypothetical protein